MASLFPLEQRISILSALSASQAVAELDMEGTILSASEDFLEPLGYRLEEVKGRHHGILVDPEVRNSREYRDLWERLKRGQYAKARFKRIAKDGKEVWTEAWYTPIVGRSGRPYKVIKYANEPRVA